MAPAAIAASAAASPQATSASAMYACKAFAGMRRVTSAAVDMSGIFIGPSTSMKKWRSEKREQPSTHQNGDPHGERSAGNDLDAKRDIRAGRELFDLVKNAGAVEDQDVGDGYHLALRLAE